MDWERATEGLIIFEEGSSVPLLIADATITEGHSRSARVSQHPRELGADLADTFQAQLPRVTATIVFSATPLGFAPEPNRPAEAYEALLDLQQSATLATLITHTLTYDNCALEEVSAPRSSSTGHALVIDTSWVVVQRVSTEEREVPTEVLASLVRASGKAKDKTKDQTGTPKAETLAAEVTAEVVALKKTVLKGVRDALLP